MAGLLNAPVSAGVENGQISGFVSGAAGGGNLSDIEVTLFRLENGAPVQDREPTLTSNRGYFSLSVPPGTYRLCFADRAGQYYSECWEDIETVEDADDIVIHGASSTELVFPSLARVGTGSVAGKVVGPQGPVQGLGAEIRLYNDGGGINYTNGAPADAQGNFRIENVPAGTYVLYYSGNEQLGAEFSRDANYVAQAAAIIVEGGEVTSVPDALLDHRPRLSGTIRNSAGKGLPGIYVRVTVHASGGDSTFLTKTASDGSFALNVAEGSAQFCYYDYDNRVYADRCWKRPGETAPFSPIEMPHTGPVRAPEAVMMLGRRVIATKTPRLLGKAEVGKILRVTKGSYQPSNVTFKYQWLANGRRIANATSPIYRVSRKQLGKRISVRLTIAARDYSSLRIDTGKSVKVHIR